MNGDTDSSSIDGEPSKSRVSRQKDARSLSFRMKTSDRMKRAADRAIILEHGPRRAGT